jgi:GT2 family glycosyltransferase
MVSGACLMVKRNVFESVGLFSTDYFMYAEDTDLCFKIRSTGLFVYYTPTASVIHHGGGSSKQREHNYFTSVVMHESLFLFLTKYRGRLYGNLYRVTTGCAAFSRVMLIIGLVAVMPWTAKRDGFRRSLVKWVKIFRWSLGLEKWVRRLNHETRAA